MLPVISESVENGTVKRFHGYQSYNSNNFLSQVI